MTPDPDRADLEQGAKGCPTDGTVVGLVAQAVSAGIAEAEVTTGQDQSVPGIGEADHTLRSRIAFILLLR